MFGIGPKLKISSQSSEFRPLLTSSSKPGDTSACAGVSWLETKKFSPENGCFFPRSFVTVFATMVPGDNSQLVDTNRGPNNFEMFWKHT